MLPLEDWLYMDGVFDLVHAGHFNAMRQASQLSENLCVGVNDDDDVLAHKGHRPVLTSAERAAIISACKWVDRTLDGTPYVTSQEFLTEGARCGYVAHGDDAVATTTGVDCYAEPRKAGLFKIFRRTNGISSTEVSARMHWACQDIKLVKPNPRVILMRTPVTTPMSSGRLVKFARKCSSSRARCPVDFRRASCTQGEVEEKAQEVPPQSSCSTPLMKDSEMNPIIYTQGAFDVLRDEQVRFLERCKAAGNYLIVGILCDADCAALDPENRHCPILGVNDRMLSVLALRVVDEVICNVTHQLDSGLLQTHRVAKVILPANTERVTRRIAEQPLTSAEPVDVPVEHDPKLGLTVNELRITLTDFSEAAQAPEFVKRLEQNTLARSASGGKDLSGALNMFGSLHRELPVCAEI